MNSKNKNSNGNDVSGVNGNGVSINGAGVNSNDVNGINGVYGVNDVGFNEGCVVSLLASTPDAKKVAFSAIRSCYSPGTARELFDHEFDKYEAKVGKNGEEHDSDRLIHEIVSHGHTSTLEHVSFTFSVSGISRACLAQLTRHRIGWSYSVQSQRYVKQSTESKHGGFEYVLPDLGYVDAKSDACRSVMKAAMEQAQIYYDVLVKWGVKAEDARMVLPQAATCNLVITCNLRAFLDGYRKRALNDHAQTEIRVLFEKMRDAIVAKEPWIEALICMIL